MKPKISSWIENWKNQFEKRVFDFSSEEDQEQFQLAIEELTKHILHVSKSASIATVNSENGIKTIYLSILH